MKHKSSRSITLGGLVCIVLFFSTLNAVIHESGSYNRTEEINASVFVCKVFFDGDEIIKEFMIDQILVDQKTYEQKKNEACQHEIDVVERSMQQKYLPFEQTCASLRPLVAIKLLKCLRDDTIKMIRLLHDHAVEQFFVFKPETISSPTFLQRIEQKLLPAFAFCDDERAKDEDFVLLKELANTMSELYDHLLLFYKDSVKAAIDQADDPKALKNLLNLL